MGQNVRCFLSVTLFDSILCKRYLDIKAFEVGNNFDIDYRLVLRLFSAVFVCCYVAPPQNGAHENAVKFVGFFARQWQQNNMNSSGDEIANVNFFTTISHPYFRIPKKENLLPLTD